MKRAIVRYGFVLMGALLVGLVLAACSEDKKEEKKSYTVGIVDPISTGGELVDAFKAAMLAKGYTEGENIAYYVSVSPDELSKQISADKLDLLVVSNGIFGGLPTNPLVRAKELADSKIPIVVAPAAGDPVESGDAESLKHPGKNITGLLMHSLDAKRFEYFVDMLPDDAKRVAVVYDPDSIGAAEALADIQDVADQAGLELILLDTPPAQVDATEQALADVPEDVDGVFMLKVWGTATQWFEWAYVRGIPTSQDGWFVQSLLHPLMSYGPSSAVIGEQAAVFADQILKRSKPGDLPMQYTDFVLRIDMGIAEGMGYEVPKETLGLADEIMHSDPSLFVIQAPASAGGAPTHPEGTGACAAQQVTMAGTFTTCIPAACNTILDSGMLQYTDRVNVGGCAVEGLVGTCSTAAFDINYYSGEVASLKMGCGFLSGTWIEPQS